MISRIAICLLVLLLLLKLLLLFIQELPEVHDAADGRVAVFRHEHEVQMRVLRRLAGSSKFHDAQLFSVRPYDAQGLVGIRTVIAFQ